MRIGTAGWSITREAAPAFPGDGSHLSRYADVLDLVEINSSFHRNRRHAVYERWAASTPPGFRFSVKLPRAITHEGRLKRAREPLTRFLAEAAGLGDRLGALLVQLPPSLVYEPRAVRRFFALLREAFDGPVVCEPRHPSWFAPKPDRDLVALRVTRAGADPARVPEASAPGGWLGPDGDGRGAVVYFRWHGSPRTYWSRYERPWLQSRADALASWPAEADCWCVFDNTAAGGAIVNALELESIVAMGSAVTPS